MRVQKLGSEHMPREFSLVVELLEVVMKNSVVC